MSFRIRAEKLGKRYSIGERDRYRALRDVLAQTAKAPFRAFGGRGSRVSKTSTESVWALKDASFTVGEGEVIGLVGRNGAGKSTLLKILARVTKPTEGVAKVRGRLGSLLEVGTGFHPELTGRENVYFSGAILGMRRREIMRKFDEIVAFAEVEKFIDTPLKRYSSGMQLRLAFAVAAHLEPEILLVDEVLAVGDAAFQKKCLGKMGEVARGGRTILFVSHQVNQIRRLCGRAMWIDAGQIRMSGPTADVVGAYEATALRGQSSGAQRLRPTSDKARFVGWEMIQAGENQRYAVSSTGQVAVRFVLDVCRSIRVVSHGIALYDSDRRLMWGNAAHDFDLGQGLKQFVYVLPTLPLRPGAYSWQLSLYDEHGLVDLWEGSPELLVSTPPVTHPRDEWAGVLNIPSEFCVSPLAEIAETTLESKVGF